MEENKQQQDNQPTDQPPVGKKRPNWFSRILGGEVLQSRAVLKQVPLILLLCFYAILLVYNRYRVEDLTKEKVLMQDSINFLRESRIELQKRYQESVRISQIAELLDSTGIGITAGPPYELSSKDMDDYLSKREYK